MDHSRIADQAAKLKNKKTHLDFILELHMTRLHKYTWTCIFFCSVLPNTEILVRQCDIEEDITTSERAFFFFPHFLDSVLFFFTVRNTFIYFLIKVDLCTSCDKPGIALFFYSITQHVLLNLFFFLPSFYSHFFIFLCSLFIFYIIFSSTLERSDNELIIAIA